MTRLSEPAANPDYKPLTALPGDPSDLNARFTALSRRVVTGVAIASLGAIGILDFLTGPGMTFTMFHLVPLAAVAWFVGVRSALVLLIISAGASIWGDLLARRDVESLALYLWNNGTRWLISVFVVFLIARLREALRRERAAARTDFLTGVANRRGFEERAEVELGRARRNTMPVTVAYLDVDGFKTVNDRFGHDRGDDLLRSLTASMVANTRVTDVVARVGGDEFVLLLPGIDAGNAVTQLAILRRRVLHAAGVEGITLSIGAITYLSAPDNVVEVMAAADRLMYGVKQAGRDSISHDIVS